MLEKRFKRAQVTIFIIIALLIIAGVMGYFLLRDILVRAPEIPAGLQPVYATFLACLEDDTRVGVNILESQGGYIELPEFEQGSSYMPFSSQLNFLGNPIPYWYYVSGNNIQREQVPSKNDMEEALGNYIEENIQECLLESYLEGGFGVSMGEPEVNVIINEKDIDVSLDMALAIEKANESVVVRKHNINVKTKLGSLYEQARNIYDYEQETLFLENYGVDTLRLYAPVDGIEQTCSPLIWNAEEVFDELEQGIEANTLSLKVKGGDFELQEEENKYFVVDIPNVEDNVLFLNSKNWSHSFEVNPSQESVMIAKPIGNQPGMSALGFCYVPYHFVYNVNYPVLVQIYSGEEIFQFPMAVVIKGNKPREALDVSAVEIPEVDLCENRNTLSEVVVYDTSLDPVAANISFECLGEICQVGETSAENGSLITLLPQCVNGFISAEAEGYQREKENLNSSAQPGIYGIILNKLYEKDVNLKLGGSDYNEQAIITFVSNDSSQTIIYPEQKEVELSQGQYEVQVYIYSDASIKLEEQVQEQCMEVPRKGLGALFGMTEERCFDIVIPEQEISNALIGGGKQNYYAVESELQRSAIIDINADRLPTPKTIEDLQKNYIEFEDKGLDIYLR